VNPTHPPKRHRLSVASRLRQLRVGQSQSLAAKAAGRLRLSPDDTARTLLALTEPELFTTYTARKRAPNQYQAWLADILCRSLLE
jgi:hypothetical protein